MRVHHDGCAALVNLSQGFAELADDEWVEAASGLIEKKETRIVDEALGDPNFLLHAFRALGKPESLELGQAQALEDVVNRLIRDTASIESRIVPGGLFDGQIEMIVRFLRQVGDVFVQRRTKFGNPTHYFHSSRSWLQKAYKSKLRLAIRGK